MGSCIVEEGRWLFKHWARQANHPLLPSSPHSQARDPQHRTSRVRARRPTRPHRPALRHLRRPRPRVPAGRVAQSRQPSHRQRRRAPLWPLLRHDLHRSLARDARPEWPDPDMSRVPLPPRPPRVRTPRQPAEVGLHDAAPQQARWRGGVDDPIAAHAPPGCFAADDGQAGPQ